MSREIFHVSVCDGKYTVAQYRGGRVEAFRYGEKWRDCTGDELILALAQELHELRVAVEDAAIERDLSE